MHRRVDLIGEAMRELLEIPRPKGEELDLRLRKTLLFLSNASELLGTFRRAEIPNSDPQPSSSDDESGGGAV